MATHSSLGRPVRFSRSSDHENTCCSESFGVRNSRPKGPTLRSETLRGTDRPRVEVCRSCSLVLPGPVRAEAARKALLVGADRGPVLGPARSRRGSQAGFCSESPSGRPLPERNHRRSRGVSFARHLRVGEPTALLIDGSSDPPKNGVGGFDTQTAPQRADLSKGTPSGAPGIAHRSARRGSTSPNPTTRASFGKLRKQDRVGLPRTTMWSRSVEPTTGSRTSWLRNGGSPVGRRGIIPGDHGNDERGNQRQEGIRHREVYGYSRGEDSEGCNPKGATGTKQGRKGSKRSARHEAVGNRTCRLSGGGNSGTTCRFVPQASKGKKPQERCQTASVGWRPSSVKLRSGDKAMRGWAQVQRIWARGQCGNTS